MSITPKRLDGYYDKNGYWLTTKKCFVNCGDRCTCQPPSGLFYNEALDQRKHPPAAAPESTRPPWNMRLNFHGNPDA